MKDCPWCVPSPLSLGFRADLKTKSINTGKLAIAPTAWWRFNTRMEAFGEVGTIAVLLGAFFFYRLADIFLVEFGHGDKAELLRYAWLGFVAYTWVAPAMFQRMLAKELEQVRLKPGF